MYYSRQLYRKLMAKQQKVTGLSLLKPVTFLAVLYYGRPSIHNPWSKTAGYGVYKTNPYNLKVTFLTYICPQLFQKASRYLISEIYYNEIVEWLLFRKPPQIQRPRLRSEKRCIKRLRHEIETLPICKSKYIPLHIYVIMFAEGKNFVWLNRLFNSFPHSIRGS